MAGEDLKVVGYGTSLLNNHPIDGREREEDRMWRTAANEALSSINVPKPHTL
jgi:hypothetical protein